MKRSRCFCFIAMMLSAPLLFAAPHDHRDSRSRHHSPPPPPPHHRHRHYSNSDLRTAADIVELVGASLATARVLTGTAPAPVVVAPAPAPVVVAPAPQPAVVSQPVYVPVQSAPQPTQATPSSPRPRSVTIHPDGTKTIKY